MSTVADSLRAQLEKCARRFHETRLRDGAAEHRHWKFENCPAASCREARKALGFVHGTLQTSAKREARP